MSAVTAPPLEIGGLQMQPLIHHAHALPISAVFTLRYVDTLVRMWAAPGMYDRRMPLK
jgi:hypothetical protein